MLRSSRSKGPAPRAVGAGGFTLVELLVSISIIGVLTGMMMANFRGGQQAAEVRLAADILVGQLRAVQTSSLTGRLAAVCSGGAEDLDACEPKQPAVTCSGGSCQKRVPAGYGIRFSTLASSEYVLFYDTDDDQRYDAGEEYAAAPYVSTAAARFQGSPSGDPLDIVYAPPFGKLYVNGSDSGPTTVSLTLGHQFGNMTRHVTIYRLSGKIEHD
ncbi:MAG: prepilin-type N-terminal cleavage/methylation domain-containing protein [Patescibacteria group bacterium]